MPRALKANCRLREHDRADNLLPEDQVRRGWLWFDLSLPEPNRDWLDHWLHFVSLSGLLDKDELRKDEAI
jgi:hypothetical protein